jgi:hypothetical protein
MKPLDDLDREWAEYDTERPFVPPDGLLLRPGAWAWIFGVALVGLALFASLVAAPWLAERIYGWWA